MPGPLDIRTEPLSYYRRLPFGLGSENMFLSMLPDWMAFGAGTAIQRHAMASNLKQRFTGWTALGAITGLGRGTPEMRSLEKRLRKAALGAGWNYGARVDAMGKVLASDPGIKWFGRRTYDYKWRMRGSPGYTGPGSPVLREVQMDPMERMGLHGSAAPVHQVVQGPPVVRPGLERFEAPRNPEQVAAAWMVTRTGSLKTRGGRVLRTEYAAREAAMHRAFGTKAGTGWNSPLPRPANVAGGLRGGGLRARSISLAKARAEQYAMGSAVRGVGGVLVGLQLGAIAADISRGIAGAAMDWRPRRNFRPNVEFGTPFMDTSAAFTMRQRSIQAIHDSQLTTRAILGREAAYLHS